MALLMRPLALLFGKVGRRSAAIATVVAVLFSGFVAVPPTAAQTSLPSAVLVVELDGASKATPGALARLDVEIHNDNEEAPLAALEMTVTMPTGVAIEEVTSGDDFESWVCSTTSSVASCSLEDNSDNTPVGLDPLEVAFANLTFSVADSVDVGSGLDIVVAADGVGLVDLSAATATASLAPAPPAQTVSIDVVDDLDAGLIRSSDNAANLEIRNMGPAELGGKNAPVVVRYPVPPQATGLTTDSEGWSCRSRTCTWNGDTIAVGEYLPTLTATFKAPSRVTPQDRPLVWDRRISAKPSGQRATIDIAELAVAIVPPPPPELVLVANLISSDQLQTSGSIDVDVVVLGRNLNDPTENVTVSADLPAGVVFSSVSSDDGWTCDGSTSVECSRSADFGRASSDLTLTFDVGSEAEVGLLQFDVVASVTGEPEELLDDNTVPVSAQLYESDAASLQFRLFSYSDNTVEPYNGLPYEFIPNTTTSLGVDAINNGSAPIPLGTEVALELDLPTGSSATTETAGPGGEWGCSVAKDSNTLNCSLTTAAPIEVSDSLPMLKIMVTPSANAKAGPVALGLTLSATLDGVDQPDLATSAELDGVVGEAPVDLPDLHTISVTFPTAPRVAGNAGILLLEVENENSKRLRPAFMHITLPEGVSTVEPFATGCNRDGLIPGADISCYVKALQPGESRRPVEVLVLAESDAVNLATGTVTVVQQFGLDETAGVDFSVPALPELAAIANAEPSSVVGQPFGLPQQAVLLDGRGSEALGADVTWRQVIVEDEPAVEFDGANGASTVNATTARFTAPIVVEPETLRFEYEVSDGLTSSVAVVEVDVAPIPVQSDDDETGWESTGSFGQAVAPGGGGFAASGALISRSPAVLFQLVDGPGWVWTTDPDVSPNDVGFGITNPIQGSRIRVFDHGTFEWNDPATPEPTNVESGHQLFLCNVDDAEDCDPISDFSTDLPDAVIPNARNVDAVLRVTVSGLVDGSPVETVESFSLGTVTFEFVDPELIVAPSIEGTVEVDQELTLNPGEWSVEFAQEYQWFRCSEAATDPEAPLTSCEELPGETTTTYTVTPFDIGSFLRARVTAFAAEGASNVATSASTIEVPDDGNGVPVEVETDLPGGTASIPNSAQFTVTGIVTGGLAPITLEWAQTAGESVIADPINGAELSFIAPAEGEGDLEFTFTAIDQRGTTDSTTVTVTYGDSDVPGILCQVLNAAVAAGTGETTVSLGSDIQLTFANATVSSEDCTSDATLTMEGATLDMFNWMRVEEIDVEVTADGVEVDGGTLTLPGDDTFSGMDFRVISDGMSIPFDAAGDDLTIDGSVIADNLTFLNLPGAWQAGAQISLATDGGEQTIGFAAVAWDTADGDAATSPDALPEPPGDAAQLLIAGEASTEQTFAFSLTATDLVKIGAVELDFEGTVTRSEAGEPVEITASAALAAPVELASGLTLTEAELAWDGSEFTGAGGLEIEANDGTLDLAAELAFSDLSNFSASLTLEPGAGDPSWTPVNGVTISSPIVVGELVQEDGNTTFDLAVSAAEVAIGQNVTLIEPTFELNVVCDPDCAPPAFAASGEVEIDLNNGEQVTVAFAGSLDLATGAFELEAEIGNLTPFDGLTLNTVAVAIAGGDGEALSILLTADATVLDVAVTVEISFDDEGFFVAVTMGDWDPQSGAPVFNRAFIVYSSYDTTFGAGAEEIEVEADTVLITAQSSAPRWFVDLIGSDPGELTILGTINVATGDFEVELLFDLPNTELLSIGGVTLLANDAAFVVQRSGGSITTGLASNGSLVVPNANGGGSAALDVVFTAGFSSSAVLSGSISVVGAWDNAFGVQDLTVSDATVQVSIGLSSFGGSFAFAGGVTLPPSWGREIGIVDGTEIRLAAQVGTADPCFGIEVGNVGSSETVLDVANTGALTAKYLSILIAPTGCSIGPDVDIPAGVSLMFDGAIMGVDVTVEASVTPVPFAFSADVEIGTVQISGFRLESAEVQVAVGPTGRSLGFAASAEVLGVEAAVTGSFSKTAGGTKASFAGNANAPNLGGFQLNELALAFEYEQTLTGQSLSASGAADVSVLGANTQVDFAFAAVNGRIIEASGSARVDIPLNSLRIQGQGDFSFASGEFPEISIAGSLEADGQQLSSMSAELTGGGLTLEATLGTAVGFTTAPRLAGTVAWRSDGSSTINIVDRNGNVRTAQPGDFRFDASNVGLGARGFSMMVDVTVGKVGTSVWAELDTNLSFGQFGNVDILGSFESNGDFELSGRAALNLAGFSPTVDVSLSRANRVMTVSGATSFSVPRLTTVNFAGTFSNHPQGGLQFNLEGNGTVEPGGQFLGVGTFKLSRVYGIGGGMEVDFQLNIPGFGPSGVTMRVDPTYLLLVANVQMNGEIGNVLGSPLATVKYAQWDGYREFSFAVGLDRLFGINGSSWVWGNIANDGSFDFSFSIGASFSATKKVGCNLKASASGAIAGRITGSANSLAISASADLKASATVCGKGVSINVKLEFSYRSPNNFDIKVKLLIKKSRKKNWEITVLKI